MTRTLLAPPLVSSVDVNGENFQKNRDDMLEQLAEIDELLDAADMGGGERSRARLRSRGKMPIRERIAHVLDPDTPFLDSWAGCVLTLASYIPLPLFFSNKRDRCGPTTCL
ncbi:MAG: hypothetical protein F6K10_09675 [Moorea sp. SIO2B7]|nr:hypothetical protein [Moorena sp. SIO2B7]